MFLGIQATIFGFDEMDYPELGLIENMRGSEMWSNLMLLRDSSGAQYYNNSFPRKLTAL